MNSSAKHTTADLMKWLFMALIASGICFNLTESLAQEPMSPGKYKAPMKYAVQLPKYCWAQYFGRTEPQFSIRGGCGPGMNHFCPGLVKLLQAQSALNKREKLKNFQSAKEDFLYTKRYMEEYPRCPLRSDMERALGEAEAGIMVFSR